MRTGVPGTPERRVVVYRSRWKLVPALVCVTFFAVLGGWIVVRGDEDVVLGGFCAVFFGIIALMGAVKLLDPRPALVLDPAGVHTPDFGLIPWSEVAQFWLVVHSGKRFLGIDVHDRDALLTRMHPLTRLVMRGNRRFAGALVNISQDVLPVDVTEVIAEMRTFRPAR